MDSSAKHLQLQQRVSQLEEEKELTQSTLREAEARLLIEVDERERAQRDLIRAHHDIDCEKMTNLRLQDEHRTERDRDEACIEKWRQNYDSTLFRSKQLEQDIEQWKRNDQELREQASSAKAAFESKVDSQTRECNNRIAVAHEAARRLEGEKRMAEAEVERVKHEQRQHYQQVEHETRELRCDKAVLEDQLRDAQEQRRSSEQEKNIAEQDLRQWYQKFIESNKENTALQRANQDHSRTIWDLENQLRQERNSGNVVRPGDFLKMMKAHEHESLASDHCRLKKANSKLQCDLDLCVKKLQEQDKTIKDLQDMLHTVQAAQLKAKALEC